MGGKWIPVVNRIGDEKCSTMMRFRGWRRNLPGDCSGWRIAGRVFVTVIRGDGGWLAMFRWRDSKKLDKRVHELSWGIVILLGRSARNRSCWMSWTYGTRRWSRIGSLCHLLREPHGFPVHGLSLLCSRVCAAEIGSAHPRSLLQDRRARSHLLRAVPVLLSHHWLLTCSRVACCLARALACWIDPNRPLTKHFRSHSRMRRFTSAWTFGSRNSAAFPPATCCDAIRAGLPPPPVLRCASNPRRVAPALTVLPLCSCPCGRTNLNYTGSSTWFLSWGLPRASNGIIPWPIG
jgi:hypothetical protein